MDREWSPLTALVPDTKRCGLGQSALHRTSQQRSRTRTKHALVQTGGSLFCGPRVVSTRSARARHQRCGLGQSALHQSRMKILIWPGHHDPVDALIKFFTHGRGAHAAFLRDDDATIHEAFLPRLRERSVLPGIDGCGSVRVGGRHHHQHRQFEHCSTPICGGTSGIPWRIGSLRPQLAQPGRASHLLLALRVVSVCMRFCRKEQMPLVRLPAGDWASPRDLRIPPGCICCGDI